MESLEKVGDKPTPRSIINPHKKTTQGKKKN